MLRREHITKYLIERNINALVELLTKGSSNVVFKDMVNEGLTAEEAESAIATLEAVNFLPNLDRTSSKI